MTMSDSISIASSAARGYSLLLIVADLWPVLPLRRLASSAWVHLHLPADLGSTGWVQVGLLCQLPADHQEPGGRYKERAQGLLASVLCEEEEPRVRDTAWYMLSSDIGAAGSSHGH